MDFKKNKQVKRVIVTFNLLFIHYSPMGLNIMMSDEPPINALPTFKEQNVFLAIRLDL